MSYPSLLYDALERDRKRLQEIKSKRRRLGSSDQELDGLSPSFSVRDSEGNPSSMKFETFLSEIKPRELKYVIGFEKP
jgi:hypothetical protein